jgi:hypothetical protein
MQAPGCPECVAFLICICCCCCVARTLLGIALAVCILPGLITSTMKQWLQHLLAVASPAAQRTFSGVVKGHVWCLLQHSDATHSTGTGIQHTIHTNMHARWETHPAAVPLLDGWTQTNSAAQCASHCRSQAFRHAPVASTTTQAAEDSRTTAGQVPQKPNQEVYSCQSKHTQRRIPQGCWPPTVKHTHQNSSRGRAKRTLGTQQGRAHLRMCHFHPHSVYIWAPNLGPHSSQTHETSLWW